MTSLKPEFPDPSKDLQARLQRLKAKAERSVEARLDGPNPIQDTEASADTRAASSTESPKSLPEMQFLESYAGQVAAELYLEPEAPKFAELSAPLPYEIQAWLDSRRMRLYSHQAESIELLRGGHNVALATQTASGKSLAFNLPTIEILMNRPGSTALYIYPAKALANDQLDAFVGLDSRFNLGTNPSSYDGDTSAADRKLVKAASRVIITNPHGLHIYLGWNAGWKRFLENLAVIVIDEAHYYSGSVGNHMAMLVRRLRRLCQHYGSDPQFFLASATIANPKAHAEVLCGVPFELVNSQGGGRPGRWFVFWDTKKDLEHSPTSQVATLARQLVRYKRQLIVFSDTRNQAEMIAKAASDRVHRVAAYRSGYSADARRNIESDLKEGRLRGVSATSALELGVDIGGIDTVILNGVPNSVASFWQRAGRAGRSGQDATVILCAGSDPMSRYMLRHPEHLLESSSEEAIINAEHTQTLRQHLVCAASELPLGDSDEAYFGPQTRQLIEDLVTNQELVRGDDGSASYQRRGRPQFSVSLSGSPEAMYTLELHEGAKSKGLEKLEASRAMREAHLGAIFHHQGAPYRVTHVDHQRARISLAVEKSANFTVAAALRNLLPEEAQLLQAGPFGTQFAWSKATLLESVVGFKEYRPGRQEPRRYSLQSPSRSISTETVTISLPPNADLGMGAEGDSLYLGSHAAEHAIAKMLPLLYISDRRDSGSLTLKNQAQPIIALFDLTEGGAGIAKIAFDRLGELFDKAISLIDGCGCSSGCPDCIFDPTCRDDQLDKRLGVITLRFLAAEISGSAGIHIPPRNPSEAISLAESGKIDLAEIEGEEQFGTPWTI